MNASILKCLHLIITWFFAFIRDAIIVSVIDTGTSILSGCCVFSVLGSMAYQQGVDIANVVNKNGIFCTDLLQYA